MNKEKSLSELSESLYEAFPTLPRAHLDAVSRRTWDYLESRWHKRKTADGPSDPFLVFYGDATNSLSDLATIAKNLGQEFACRSGCSHCCKSEAINLGLDEILTIAEYLHFEEGKATERKVKGKTNGIGQTRQMPSLSGPGSPCLFLINDRCSVHEARPISCRSYYSKNEKDCRNLLNGGKREITTIPDGRAIENTFWEITRPNGVHLFEINATFKYLMGDLDMWNMAVSGKLSENDLIAAGLPFIKLKAGKVIPIDLV